MINSVIRYVLIPAAEKNCKMFKLLRLLLFVVCPDFPCFSLQQRPNLLLRLSVPSPNVVQTVAD